MKAAILSIGSELLQGFLTDSNSTYLGGELTDRGIDVVGVFHVGDDLDRIVLTLRRALDDADIVVSTGGIGPTADDLSREAVAAICGETPVVDPQTLEDIRAYFRRRGSEMPDRNAKQAWKIPSAEIMPNGAGTAPGWFVRFQDKAIILMPGPPREMTRMWREQALPRLSPMLPDQTIHVQTLKTIGIGESMVEQMLENIIQRGQPVVSTYAKNDGVHVRIVASATDAAEAQQAVSETEGEIRSILGESVYGTLETPLVETILQPLADTDRTLDIWESGTGGQVATLLLSDDRYADVVEHTEVTKPTRPGDGNPGNGDPVKLVRAGLASMPERPTNRIRLGAAALIGEPDSMGRHDAAIAIIITNGHGELVRTHSAAAAPLEIGRRVSLLAAEALRRAILHPEALRRS